MKKALLFIGMALSCPFAFSNCDFSMKNVTYFHQADNQYNVSLKMKNACSGNSVYKRELEDIELVIYKNKQKVLTVHYDRGLWMPSLSKFMLKQKRKSLHNCFDKEKSITLNLKKSFINSTRGLYLNLNDGSKHNVVCPELFSI